MSTVSASQLRAATAHAYDYAQRRRLRRAPARRQRARHLHRRARPLHRRDAGHRPRDQPLARPPSSSPASPRSSASAASRSASSPPQEELPFAGHPTLGTASWLYLQSPTLSRGAEHHHARPPRRPHPRHASRPAATSSPASSAPCGRTIPVFGDSRTIARRRRRARPRRRRPRPRSAPSRPSPPACRSASFRCARWRSPRAWRSRSTLARPISPTPTRSSSTASPVRNSRLRRRLARAHAVLQRRRSRHRLGLRLRHRLPRAPRRSCRADKPIVIEQGIEMLRPSRIHVSATLDGDAVTKVFVGGRTIPVATGRLFLP